MDYLTVREAAEVCGLSVHRIRDAINDGTIEAFRFGNKGRYRIKPQSIADALGLPVEEIQKKADEVKTIWG